MSRESSKLTPRERERNRRNTRAWKKKHPKKVAMQKRRALERKKLEKKTDPTGELEYAPIPGTDTPYEEPNRPDHSLESGARDEANPPGAALAGRGLLPQDAPDALGLSLDQPESALVGELPGQGIEEPADFTGEVQRYHSFLRLKTDLATAK